jgi:hypothetical protein
MLIERGDVMKVTLCVGGAVCFALVLVSTAKAQEKPAGETKGPAYHRIEIYNGPYRTVHYYSDGASAEDQTKLRDRERNENEAAMADQLQALLRQYVADESILERRRRNVQLLFYGHSNVISEVYPYYNEFYPSYDAPYGYGYYAPYNSFGYSSYWPGFTSVTSTNGLFGVGDEGRLKSELVRSLAAKVMPPPKP